jgi:hypothetical protein
MAKREKKSYKEQLVRSLHRQRMSGKKSLGHIYSEYGPDIGYSVEMINEPWSPYRKKNKRTGS